MRNPIDDYYDMHGGRRALAYAMVLVLAVLLALISGGILWLLTK